MITERLLFAVHQGQVNGRPAGIIMQHHCLPIACSHDHCSDRGAPVAEWGILECWEGTCDVEDFFGEEGLDIGPGIINCGAKYMGNSKHRPSGLYVYEVTYDLDDDIGEDEDEAWVHLHGGELRRPTAEDLEPLTRGEAPWGGIVL